jgi:Uma2 family endonuclease
MGMAISVPRYTVDDLERFPRDGNRYELLDGMLLVTPAPRLAHQLVASRLLQALAAGSRDVAHVVGPGAVVRVPRTQLEPDLLVFPSRFSPSLSWADITGHWLAVEVLSRSSRWYDREYKRDAYFQLGVSQVWLVDIDERSVDAWRSRTEHEVIRDVIHWSVPSTERIVEIPLDRVFAGLAEA